MPTKWRQTFVKYILPEMCAPQKPLFTSVYKLKCEKKVFPDCLKLKGYFPPYSPGLWSYCAWIVFDTQLTCFSRVIVIKDEQI